MIQLLHLCLRLLTLFSKLLKRTGQVCHCYPLKIDSEIDCIGWNNLSLVLRLVEDIKTPDNQSIGDAAVQCVKRIMASGIHDGVHNMTVDDFRQSLTTSKPPAKLTLALIGL